jgi:translation initiation factor IF-3
MDYGKYKYEQKKKAASKKSHSASLKEVKLRPGTDQHDLNFKLNNARKFLMEGDKVKVTVMFRGREMVHTYRGREQLDEVLKQLGSIAKLESSPRMEGRFMSMILVADREAVAEMKRAAEQDGEAGSAEASSPDAETGSESTSDSQDGIDEGAKTSGDSSDESGSEEIKASDDASGQESGADESAEAQTVRE